MNDGSIGLIFFAIAAGGVILYFVTRIVRYGGFKAAMFGARIERTVGEVYGSGSKFMGSTIRVHVLEGDAEKAIGLEVVQKGPGAYSMQPCSLSASEASKLVQLIQSALSRPRG